MTRLSVERTLTRDRAAALLAPRDDIVAEAPPTDGAGATVAEIPTDGTTVTLSLAHGPFTAYRRTVTVSPVGGPTPDGDGGGGGGGGGGGDGDRGTADDEDPGTARSTTGDGDPGTAGTTAGDRDAVTVTQTFDYTLPPGIWPVLTGPLVRRGLARPRPHHRMPWWFPPQRPDARGATVLGLLATLSIIVGYHGTLLTQTMTFAADEFGAGTAAQGDALAAVRIGGLLAIALGSLADRRGRRMVLTLSLLTCVVATVAGGFAPDLVTLTVTQAVNRGAWAAASILLAIVAAEEMPAGARAYALSLLAMTGALGAGMALWILPVADLGESAWRILYVVPVLFVPLIFRFGRLVPESRRFVRPHRNVVLRGHYARLLLVAGSSFLLNLFAAPQSQFRNEFLRNERGMSALAITAFVLVTSTPAGVGIVVGGRLADTRGRRVVGATGITVGTVLIALSFVLQGAGMWISALTGGIFAAALVPTITVYGPELFPTSLRGRANGIVSTTAMAGSVVGLAAFGRLETATGSFGRAIAVLAVAPIVMAAVVLAWFPETARRELEDLNPEDDEHHAGERAGDRPGDRPDDARGAAGVGPVPPG